jgi:hypothetical protein
MIGKKINGNIMVRYFLQSVFLSISFFMFNQIFSADDRQQNDFMEQINVIGREVIDVSKDIKRSIGQLNQMKAVIPSVQKQPKQVAGSQLTPVEIADKQKQQEYLRLQRMRKQEGSSKASVSEGAIFETLLKLQKKLIDLRTQLIQKEVELESIYSNNFEKSFRKKASEIIAKYSLTVNDSFTLIRKAGLTVEDDEEGSPIKEKSATEVDNTCFKIDQLYKKINAKNLELALLVQQESSKVPSNNVIEGLQNLFSSGGKDAKFQVQFKTIKDELVAFRYDLRKLQNKLRDLSKQGLGQQQQHDKIKECDRKCSEGIKIVNHAVQEKKVIVVEDLEAAFLKDLPQYIQNDFRQNFLPAFNSLKEEQSAQVGHDFSQGIKGEKSSAQSQISVEINNSILHLTNEQKALLTGLFNEIYEMRKSFMNYTVAQLRDELKSLVVMREKIKREFSNHGTLLKMIFMLCDDTRSFLENKLLPWSSAEIAAHENMVSAYEAQWKKTNTGTFDLLNKEGLDLLTRYAREAHDIALQATIAYDSYYSKYRDLQYDPTWDDYKRLEDLTMRFFTLINSQFEVVDARAKRMMDVQKKDVQLGVIQKMQKIVVKSATEVFLEPLAKKHFAMKAVTEYLMKNALDVKGIQPAELLQAFERFVGYDLYALTQDTDLIRGRYMWGSSQRPKDVFDSKKAFFIQLIKKISAYL